MCFREHGGAVVAFTAKSTTPVLDSDVVGEQCADFIPVSVREERVEASIGTTRGVLERRPRTLPFQPGICGVEFGDSGVQVFDVEPHLQRKSTLFVEAE